MVEAKNCDGTRFSREKGWHGAMENMRGTQWLSPWFSRLALVWVTLGYSLEARLGPVIARKSCMVIWWRGSIWKA